MFVVCVANLGPRWLPEQPRWMRLLHEEMSVSPQLIRSCPAAEADVGRIFFVMFPPCLVIDSVIQVRRRSHRSTARCHDEHEDLCSVKVTKGCCLCAGTTKVTMSDEIEILATRQVPSDGYRRRPGGSAAELGDVDSAACCC